MLTVGPVQENCFLVRREGADRAVIVDPGEEAPRLLGGDRAVGRHARRDPADAHALRPRRRGRAGRAGDGRARLLPGDRAPRARGHHEIRPVARLRTVRVLRGRPPRQRRRAADARGDRLRRASSRPATAPATSRTRSSDEDGTALFSGDVLFQQLDRPHRPARRRPRAPDAVDPGAARRLPGRRDRLPGPHGHHDARRRARDAIPSCRRSPGSAGRRAIARPAMSAKLQAPRGTYDVLPDDAARREAVEVAARRILGAAGYRRIETPTFEATELFARGVGASTDVVQKEMYTFDDGGGRSMTLRPEGTAPVCRAYVEHGMHKLAPAGPPLVPVELLPPRGAAGRPPPPVLAGRRGGARLRRACRSTRSRSCCWRSCSTRSACATCACASPASAAPRRAPPTARSCRRYLRAHEAR